MGAAASNTSSANHLPGFIIPPADQVVRTLRRNATEPCLRRNVKVLVWNIHKQQTRGFDLAFDRLARDSDLVLLQELHWSKNANNEDLILPVPHNATYVMATSFLYASDNSPTGVAIGSTVAPTESVEAQVTADREPIIGTPKVSLLAEFPLCDLSSEGPTTTMVVASVHGLNRAPLAAFERQMDALVDRLRTHDGPMLVAGDFNTQSAAKTDYLTAAMSLLGLRDISFSPDDRTVSKLTRRPLDHAFVRGASARNAACWRGGSDHAAMTFDLTLEFPGDEVSNPHHVTAS